MNKKDNNKNSNNPNNNSKDKTIGKDNGDNK